MLMLLSFSSFFSSFVTQRHGQLITALSAHERNETYEQTHSRTRGIVSVISSNSFISFPVFFRDAAKILPFCSGVIADSQPTRCGHTLRGVPCRGWRGALRPFEPLPNCGLLLAYRVRRRGSLRSCVQEHTSSCAACLPCLQTKIRNWKRQRP